MEKLSNEIKENRISTEKMTDEKIDKFREDISEIIPNIKQALLNVSSSNLLQYSSNSSTFLVMVI